MSRHLTLIALLGLATACGRGQFDLAGLSGGTDPRDASAPGPTVDSGRHDGPVAPIEDASGRDVPLLGDGFVGNDARSDAAPPTDSGVPFQCQAPADCFVTLGQPPCPDGRGRWQCLNGACVPECPVVACRTDCDCPFELSCTQNGCIPLNRANFCCANPMCRPGQACVNPDGTTDRCEGPRDGGTRDTGPRDAGPAPDGGGGRDALPTDGPTMTCGSDCDCDPFLACLNGQCLPAGRPNLCCTSPQCPAGSMCIQPDGSGGVCGQTPVGAACDPNSLQCGPGFCIDENSGFPGGYCTDNCGRNNPCPPGASCRNGGGGGGFCLDECNVPGDCRAGYNCVLLGVASASRVCWPVPPTSTNPMGAPVGSSCSGDNDCVSGTNCLQEQGFPGGYCTTLYCDPVTNPCPGGSSCYAFPGLFSLCLAECPSGGMRSTCRPQYYCLGPTNQPGVCIGN